MDFPYAKAYQGYIDGYVRRFWQASWDHRGTRESPGRVVTLVARESQSLEGQLSAYEASHRVFGMVYELDPGLSLSLSVIPLVWTS